jgi:glycosyltransferase involved in cell wall biosynthesis
MRISILVPGMPFGPETLETKSLGGAESAGAYMARALAAEGAQVTVFRTGSTSVSAAGVRYAPADEWTRHVERTVDDVCIVQRTPEAFEQVTCARLNLLWCHEYSLARTPEYLRRTLWNIDRVIVLSRYMLDEYRSTYELDESPFFVSRNGIDVELFRRLRAEAPPREPKKLIFTARAERGLDIMLRHVMPWLLAREPELRLFIAGYDVEIGRWRQLHTECDALIAGLGSRVVRLGALSKAALYRQLLSSRAFVYPTPSPLLPNCREVSCISVMECQAAGLPVVSTSIGALPETMADGAGTLIRLDPSAPASLPGYVEQFGEAVLGWVRDDAAWAKASQVGVLRSAQLDWSAVARAWLTEFEGWLRLGKKGPVAGPSVSSVPQQRLGVRRSW